MGIKLSTLVKESSWLNAESLKKILDDIQDDSVLAKVLSIEEIEGDSFDKKKKEQKAKFTLLIEGEEKAYTPNNTALKVLVSWLDSKGHGDDSDMLIGVMLNLSLTVASNGKDSIVIKVSRKQSKSTESPTINHNAQITPKTENTTNGQVGQREHIGFDDPAHAKGSEAEILAEFRRDSLMVEIANLQEAIRSHSQGNVVNNSITFAINPSNDEKTVKLLSHDVYSKASGVKLESYKRDLEHCLDCLNSGFIAW